MKAKPAVLAALALSAAAAYFPLSKQAAYAKVVTTLANADGLIVPIAESDLAAIQEAVAREGEDARAQRLKAGFTYGVARVAGRELTVRPAYTETQAPAGPVMTMTVLDFLRSAAEDPKAEGVSVNPGAPDGTFSVTLDKAQVLRVIESLKRRGFK